MEYIGSIVDDICRQRASSGEAVSTFNPYPANVENMVSS